MSVQSLTGRTALITGANHGIGAATAIRGQLGADVAITYLRLEVQADDTGRPDEYAEQRGATAGAVVDAIESVGGRASP